MTTYGCKPVAKLVKAVQRAPVVNTAVFHLTLVILNSCKEHAVSLWAGGQLTRFVEYHLLLASLSIARPIGISWRALVLVLAINRELPPTAVDVPTGGKKVSNARLPRTPNPV